MPDRTAASVIEGQRIADDAWEELQRTPYVQERLGIVPARLPDMSIAEAERRSSVGRSLLARLDALDLDTLPHDLALTMRLVRFRATTWAREADWYWLAIDPLGIGFFGLFLPTAYCGGYLLSWVHSRLAACRLEKSADADGYLVLVADYARLLDQFAERTAGQAERGIRMPRAQIEQARALLAAFKGQARGVVGVASQEIESAFDRALAGLSEDYYARAPDGVGIGQYPGGAELYAELVKLHTTLPLTPEQVHQRGLERMASLQESMSALRVELDFEGDHAAFVAHLNADPRWRAHTADGVAARFEQYLERIECRLPELFPPLPRAGYSIAPLPEALQGAMTFGYYDAPRSDRPQGIYYFNSANLTRQALCHIGGIVYHEIVPGHHLHLAAQQEDESLHPFRTHCYVNAYNEGWAEYAAAFAGEIGMYETPEEAYGRLMFDAFLTCRLVVDTGMNVLGWPLKRGRDYLRAHSGLSETEIESESLRYSCDRPGQALAYKLGDSFIFGLRERMRAKLGAEFSVKNFHAAILAPGALPLPDLEWHIERDMGPASRGFASSPKF